MCKATLHKHLCKGVNKEVHLSSGINILVQVVIKGYLSCWKSRKQLRVFFFQEVLIFLLLLLCLVLSRDPFTKPLGSWTKRIYNLLKWVRTQVEVQLAGHLRSNEDKAHLSPPPEIAK